MFNKKLKFNVYFIRKQRDTLSCFINFPICYYMRVFQKYFSGLIQFFDLDLNSDCSVFYLSMNALVVRNNCHHISMPNALGLMN